MHAGPAEKPAAAWRHAPPLGDAGPAAGVDEVTPPSSPSLAARHGGAGSGPAQLDPPLGLIGVRAEGLRVEYDGFVAVDNISFELAPGESFGIVGESGSGKSTVLRALRGLAPLASGRVRLTGGDALLAPGSKAFRRQVQMVFQDPYGSLRPFTSAHSQPSSSACAARRASMFDGSGIGGLFVPGEGRAAVAPHQAACIRAWAAAARWRIPARCAAPRCRWQE